MVELVMIWTKTSEAAYMSSFSQMALGKDKHSGKINNELIDYIHSTTKNS